MQVLARILNIYFAIAHVTIIVSQLEEYN